MRLLLLADSDIGYEILQWLLSKYPDDLSLVVVTSENEICNVIRKANVPLLFYQSSEQVSKYISENRIEIDIGIMAWWPKLIKQPLIGLPRYGFINTHPSFLPYNRGKNYNFWALVEQVFLRHHIL